MNALCGFKTYGIYLFSFFFFSEEKLFSFAHFNCACRENDGMNTVGGSVTCLCTCFFPFSFVSLKIKFSSLLFSMRKVKEIK